MAARPDDRLVALADQVFALMGVAVPVGLLIYSRTAGPGGYWLPFHLLIPLTGVTMCLITAGLGWLIAQKVPKCGIVIQAAAGVLALVGVIYSAVSGPVGP